MINILIPLIAGILLLIKPDMFLKKDLDEETAEKKRGLFNKIGWGLIGVSILYFLSKILTSSTGR